MPGANSRRQDRAAKLKPYATDDEHERDVQQSGDARGQPVHADPLRRGRSQREQAGAEEEEHAAEGVTSPVG